MRIHRFFIDSSFASKKTLDIENTDTLNQWRNVFRFKAGERVVLFNGSGFDFLCEISVLTKQNAVLSVLSSQKNIVIPKREVWLYSSLIKKDKFEWVVEKGTEIGVSHFVPVISERSEKKNLNLERLKRILVEAAEQSGHAVLPTLHPVVSLKEALETLSVPAIFFDAAGAVFTHSASENTVAVFIGPEGGWSEKEKEIFGEKNIPSLSLGTMTLKSETAALAAASLLLIV